MPYRIYTFEKSAKNVIATKVSAVEAVNISKELNLCTVRIFFSGGSFVINANELPCDKRHEDSLRNRMNTFLSEVFEIQQMYR